MSGGHWDYSQHKLQECLSDVALDPETKKRFPKVSKVLSKLSNVLYSIVHDIDWDFSGDSSIDDDKKFDDEAIQIIKNALKGISDFKDYEKDKTTTGLVRLPVGTYTVVITEAVSIEAKKEK